MVLIVNAIMAFICFYVIFMFFVTLRQMMDSVLWSNIGHTFLRSPTSPILGVEVVSDPVLGPTLLILSNDYELTALPIG